MVSYFDVNLANLKAGPEVLILVVMEDGLVLKHQADYNQYYNVLILVVMEDGLVLQRVSGQWVVI